MRLKKEDISFGYTYTGPSKPQLSDRDQNRTDTNNADHGFRWHFASLRVFLVGIDLVHFLVRIPIWYNSQSIKCWVWDSGGMGELVYQDVTKHSR